MVNNVLDSSNVKDCAAQEPCLRQPCLNNGTCDQIDPINYKCSCNNDFTGNFN